MASIGYIKTILNRLTDSKTKNALTQAFEHLCDTVQIGGIEHQEKAVNLKMVRLDSTTATVADEEFSIMHGLSVAPLFAIPLVPLNSSGTWSVRLKVSRPADASRMYFRSPDTNAPFSVLVEY